MQRRDFKVKHASYNNVLCVEEKPKLLHITLGLVLIALVFSFYPKLIACMQLE